MRVMLNYVATLLAARTVLAAITVAPTYAEQDQNGTSSSAPNQVWYPKMAGLIGSVPYGVVGSVAALAMGATTTAAPIAAAAKNGATYFFVAFIIVLLFDRPSRLDY